jgi:hypothetical protein
MVKEGSKLCFRIRKRLALRASGLTRPGPRSAALCLQPELPKTGNETNSMPRPKKSPTEARTEKLQIRVSAGEHLAIAEQAAAAGLTVTDYVRAVVLSGAAAHWRRAARETLRKEGTPVPATTRAAIAKLAKGGKQRRSLLRPRAMDPTTFHELRRQGVNLNQIAHRMNALDLPPPAELTEVLERIRAIIAQNVPGVR